MGGRIRGGRARLILGNPESSGSRLEELGGGFQQGAGAEKGDREEGRERFHAGKSSAHASVVNRGLGATGSQEPLEPIALIIAKHASLPLVSSLPPGLMRRY